MFDAETGRVTALDGRTGERLWVSGGLAVLPPEDGAWFGLQPLGQDADTGSVWFARETTAAIELFELDSSGRRIDLRARLDRAPWGPSDGLRSPLITLAGSDRFIVAEGREDQLLVTRIDASCETSTNLTFQFSAPIKKVLDVLELPSESVEDEPLVSTLLVAVLIEGSGVKVVRFDADHPEGLRAPYPYDDGLRAERAALAMGAEGPILVVVSTGPVEPASDRQRSDVSGWMQRIDWYENESLRHGAWIRDKSWTFERERGSRGNAHREAIDFVSGVEGRWGSARRVLLVEDPVEGPMRVDCIDFEVGKVLWQRGADEPPPEGGYWDPPFKAGSWLGINQTYGMNLLPSSCSWPNCVQRNRALVWPLSHTAKRGAGHFFAPGIELIDLESGKRAGWISPSEHRYVGADGAVTEWAAGPAIGP